jgi:diguanylate cyclase (GGDEF)-like protein
MLRSMKFNTAALLAVVGLALWILRYPSWRRQSVAIRACGLFIVVVATATLAEFAFGCEIGIDELFWQDDTGLGIQGRMAMVTALSFCILGTALFWLTSPSIFARRAAQSLLLMTLLIPVLVIVGYLYDSAVIYRYDGLASMAPHTAVTLILASIGMLWARNDFELMEPIRGQRIGGLLAKTSLPGLIGVPVILGWLLLQGERMELYGFASGVTVFVVLTAGMLGRVVWYSARSLNDVDRQREEAWQREQEMRELSGLDPLTGVLNRRRLCDQFERELNRSIRNDRRLSCVMLDVDIFKRINDTHGHVAGDMAIKAVARILIRECRSCDLVARYGGDEFCVMVPESDEAGAAKLAERLRSAAASEPIHVVDQVSSITVSLGVAECFGFGDAVESLIERADRALYAAKRNGRNRVTCFSEIVAEEARTDNPEHPRPLSTQDIVRSAEQATGLEPATAGLGG